MTVEGRSWRDDRSRDQFPVGMRVLAVDDDPTCLKLLERLLLRCQYHVTTTNQATRALELLREHKDKFDLVISDVHMPDMDGFKLLELVGLEMDLPVIMLSANGETKAVMKGITHGACDYLLKPVRIEELRNIWQHVIRRKKFDCKDNNNYDDVVDCEKPQHVNSEGGYGAVSNGSPDCNEKLNRKRKDQNDEDEDFEENMQDNEDSSTQKKPRVVWSVELHRKFVAAVNQLGIEKAVPKRILDLMNVERLTRENVASHLQKYRLYLKRISAVATQHANMAAALGGRDPSYLAMCSMDGFGNFHPLAASGHIQPLSSFQPNGMLNLTSPTGSGLQGLARSGIVHFGQAHNNTSNSINDLSKSQHVNISGNLHGNLLQGMPTSLELDQLPQSKRMHETNPRLSGGLAGSVLATGSSNNSFANAMGSSLLFQAPQQQHMQPMGLASHSSARIPAMSSHPFEMSGVVSSNSSDLGRCNETWQHAPLTGYTTKTLSMAVPVADPSMQDDLPSSITGAYAIPGIPTFNSNPLNISSSRVAPMHEPALGKDLQSQSSSLGGAMMLMPTNIHEGSKFFDFKRIDNSRQKWQEVKQDHTGEPSVVFGSPLNFPLSNNSVVGPTVEEQSMDNGIYNKKMNTNIIGQMNFSVPMLTQSCGVGKTTTDGQLKHRDEIFLETPKLLGGLNSNGCNIDDLFNAMIKQERHEFTIIDGEMGCDIFPLGACM